MAENAPTPSDDFRIRVRQKTAERLAKVFPGVSYDDAIVALLDRLQGAIGDHANCGTTELWIKLDRIEEALALLGLTNIEIGDLYRRQVGGELTVMRKVSGHLADIVTAHVDKETQA